MVDTYKGGIIPTPTPGPPQSLGRSGIDNQFTAYTTSLQMTSFVNRALFATPFPLLAIALHHTTNS